MRSNAMFGSVIKPVTQIALPQPFVRVQMRACDFTHLSFVPLCSAPYPGLQLRSMWDSEAKAATAGRSDRLARTSNGSNIPRGTEL